MSRTFRKRGNVVPRWITHDFDFCSGTWAKTPTYLKPDHKKCLAKWHSDSYYKTGIYNQHNWKLHRAEATRELQKWKTNPEHEVQIRRKRYFMWD